MLYICRETRRPCMGRNPRGLSPRSLGGQCPRPRAAKAAKRRVNLPGQDFNLCFHTIPVRFFITIKNHIMVQPVIVRPSANPLPVRTDTATVFVALAPVTPIRSPPKWCRDHGFGCDDHPVKRDVPVHSFLIKLQIQI